MTLAGTGECAFAKPCLSVSTKGNKEVRACLCASNRSTQGVVMRIDSMKPVLLALAVSSSLLVCGCSDMAVGGSKNPVGGSAGGAASANAAKTLEHCDRPLARLQSRKIPASRGTSS